MPILRYLFSPNPGVLTYSSASVQMLLVMSAALIAAAIVLRYMRPRFHSGSMKKLTASWGVACGWFGVTSALMTICRVEHIQFFAMRFLWVVWGAFILFFSLGAVPSLPHASPSHSASRDCR
jgi:hypothetical protein